MIFKKTTIENFFSIGSQVVWEMENQGLVLISGENGAGKSTLFEALLWCLWGKTIRGQQNDEVVNRKIGKNCRVTVRLEHDGTEYDVTRTRKYKGRNGLLFSRIDLVDGKEEKTDLSQGTPTLTQARIDAFLGIDFTTFTQGPMLPQGSMRKFSEMSDGEQKRVLEQALQLSILAVAREEARKRLSKAQLSHSAAEESFFRAWRHHEELKDLKARYEAERSSWLAKKRHSLALIAREQLQEIQSQEALWGQAKPIQCPFFLDQSSEEIAAMKKAKDKLQDKLHKNWKYYQKVLAEERAQLRQLEIAEKDLQREIRAIKRLRGACPTCRQEIGKDHTESCVQVLQEKLDATTQEVEKTRKSIHVIDKESKEDQKGFCQRLEEKLAKIEKAEEDHRALSVEIASSKSWIEDLEGSHRRSLRVQKRFMEKQQEKSPYDGLLEDVAAKIKATKKELKIKNSKVQKWKIEADHLQFWSTGFSNKGLKSYILKSVTPFLNSRVARYTQTLTGGQIYVEFSTQTTLKSGETREKFTVMVTNRNGAETYAGNSGGEKSRADIAINFSLSDLVSSRAQRPYRQRFLDEPFENLDEPGVESVMELLADMVSDSGSIFVITHLDSMKGLFNRGLHLEKDHGFTKVLP